MNPMRALVTAAAAAWAMAGPVHAAMTAKGALADATRAAQKWQADAALTHVSTLAGQGDGKAASWLYTFYSPKAKKSAIVTARDSKVEVEADVRNTSVDALGAEFVDSDQIAAAAAKAGLKIDKASGKLGYGLVVGNQAVGKPQLFWSLTVMGDDGMSSITLDGRTGAFVRRNDQKFK